MKTVTGNNKYNNPWSIEEDDILWKELMLANTKVQGFKNASIKLKRSYSAIRCRFYHSGTFR
jgi:hypothetical protein